jgi:ketosteroid isomerase-like protein
MAEECGKACQLNQVKAYFSALDKVSKKGSVPSDIEALLDLTHDDVKYIHVEYQANFTKDTWRKAFLRNLKLGRYQDTDKNQTRILNSIEGKNHLAIEYSHGLIQENGKWEKTNKYLAIFGFTDGKLSLIQELW